MENPLELSAPIDPIERIHSFARDLAYGAVHKKWSALNYDNTDLKHLIDSKYGGNAPDHSTLLGLGYAQMNPLINMLVLTEKAYGLLERPTVPPSVFIAYGTQESSAFALACEYRLQSKDIRVFIDRSLVPGMQWNPHLEGTIKNSKVMVCLLTSETMNRSTYIQKEIGLARDNGLIFISIGHSGFEIDKHCTAELKPFLSENQAIKVTGETAKGYHDAIEELVNALGFFGTR